MSFNDFGPTSTVPGVGQSPIQDDGWTNQGHDFYDPNFAGNGHPHQQPVKGTGTGASNGNGAAGGTISGFGGHGVASSTLGLTATLAGMANNNQSNGYENGSNMGNGHNGNGVDLAPTVVRPRGSDEKRSNAVTEREKALEATRMKAYLALRELTERYNVHLPMVQIVIIGGESSGKSSLLQAFLQFPASFCAKGTGTRCPVEYTLIYDPSVTGEVPRVWVSNGPTFTPINAQGLEAWVKEQMVRVQGSSGFSETPIKVKLEWNRYRPIQVLDCPGLVAGRNKIVVENITRTWARRPDTLLVCTIGSNDNQTQLTHVQTINRLMTDPHSMPPRIDWKNHVQFVCTFFDNFMTQMFTAAMANDGFAEKAKMNPVYCCLAPWISLRQEFDTQAFKEKTLMIREAPALERQLLDDYFIRLRSDRSTLWQIGNEKSVGIPVVLETIYTRWAQGVDGQLPTVQAKLQELVEAAEKKAKLTKSLAAPIEDSTLTRHMFIYADTTVLTMQRYMRASAEDEHMFPVATQGRTFWQEIEEVKVWMRSQGQTPTAWPPLDELKFETFADKTKDSEEGKGLIVYLSNLLRGAQQIDRLFFVFEYLIRITRFPTFTDSQIRSWAGSLAGAKTSQLQTEHAVRSMVQLAIQRNFNPGCNWFEWHMRYLYHQWLKNVHTGLTMTKNADLDPLTSLDSSILKLPPVVLPPNFPRNLIKRYEQISVELIKESMELYRKMQKYDQAMILSDQSTILHDYVSDIKVKTLDMKSGSSMSTTAIPIIIKSNGGPHSQAFEAPMPSVERVLKGIGGKGDFLKHDRHKLISESAYADAYRSAIELYDGTIGRLLLTLKSIFTSNVHLAIQEENTEVKSQLASLCFDEAAVEQKARQATVDQRRQEAEAAAKQLAAMVQARDDATVCLQMFQDNRTVIIAPNLEFLGDEADVEAKTAAAVAMPVQANDDDEDSEDDSTATATNGHSNGHRAPLTPSHSQPPPSPSPSPPPVSSSPAAGGKGGNKPQATQPKSKNKPKQAQATAAQ